jgi:hypothetical protein
LLAFFLVRGGLPLLVLHGCVLSAFTKQQTLVIIRLWALRGTKCVVRPERMDGWTGRFKVRQKVSVSWALVHDAQTDEERYQPQNKIEDQETET